MFGMRCQIIVLALEKAIQLTVYLPCHEGGKWRKLGTYNFVNLHACQLKRRGFSHLGDKGL